MRKKFIAGNWKMNKTPAETTELVNEIKAKLSDPACDVVICTPYTGLYNALEAAKGSVIKVGAENMHFKDNGAFTGEISADMLKEMNVEYVILGHSERRQYFGETDETVNLKHIKAHEKGLIPIVCVGETLVQREQGITEDLINMQTKIAFLGISREDALKTVIAYEPVWAIGTGKTATKEQADEVCGIIRKTIEKLYDKAVADEIRILYGGSMNAKNCEELLAMPDIDGGLIGGASLKAEDFNIIINSAKRG